METDPQGEGSKTQIVSQDNTRSSVTKRERERERDYEVISDLVLVKVQLCAMLDKKHDKVWATVAGAGIRIVPPLSR